MGKSENRKKESVFLSVCGRRSIDGRREGRKRMTERLEGYLDRKRLVLNVGKPKVMRFKKGGGKMKKTEWR